MKDEEEDSAKVKIPPPLALLFFILVGFAINFFCPLPFLSWFFRVALSLVLLSTSAGIIIWCSQRFKKAETSIEPWKATTSIISDGLYAYSRNPIYLAGILLGLGLATALNSLWIVMAMLPYFLVINILVIPKEEAYLSHKFGEGYQSYCRKTRRWL